MRAVMNTLAEVRETEANIDRLITPIEDLYFLLLRWPWAPACPPACRCCCGGGMQGCRLSGPGWTDAMQGLLHAPAHVFAASKFVLVLHLPATHGHPLLCRQLTPPRPPGLPPGRYEVRVPKEETDLVGDLRYSWRKLKKLAAETADSLSRLQVGFKRTLLQEVKAFVVDAVAFRQDWEASGPTVTGLDPMDATDRLHKFQQLFEVRKRKWVSYTQGEELFGLPVTRYPELARTEEEITMLDKLYSIYVNVITTLRGFGDYLWVDVVERIDAMGTQVRVRSGQELERAGQGKGRGWVGLGGRGQELHLP